LADFGTGMGFGTKAQQDSQEQNALSVVQNALRKAFSPEFLNRVDDTIMFKSLKREDIHLIIDIELEKLLERIGNLGYHVSCTEAAKDFIAEKGYDEKFGARPLKRAIQKYVEDPLAEEIINSNLQEGDTIVLDFETGAELLKLSIEKAKPSKKKAGPKAE
jgi:ATP-dependent Clp protease ATP-binding subunit ClpC